MEFYESKITIEFSNYEDVFQVTKKTIIGTLIKRICYIHGLDYKYYSLYCNGKRVNPNLPCYAYTGKTLNLYQRFNFL